MLLTHCRHDQLFVVQRLECDGNVFFRNTSTFFATVSKDIFFLAPGANHLLTLVAAPISEKTSVVKLTSESDTSTTLHIRYSGDEGDRFVNGSRGAINSLTITFCDKEGSEAFINALEGQCNSKTLEEATQPTETPKKHSMAIIDISSWSAGQAKDRGFALDNAGTSESHVSSPLGDLSLRTRLEKAADLSTRKQVITSLSEADAESGEDTPVLKKAPDSRQLIERLRASQEEATSTTSAGEPSSRRLRRSPRNNHSTAGASKKVTPPHLPTATTGSSQALAPAPGKSRSNRKRPAEPSGTSLSNQAKKRSKPATTSTGQASSNRENRPPSRTRQQGAAKMARLTGAPKDDSQASAVPAKAGLKRRANPPSTTSKSEDSQESSKAASNAIDFDIPSSDVKNPRPAKKTKTNKPAPKAPAKAPVDKKKAPVQVEASPKGGKKKASDKPKAQKSPKKGSQTTAASTRAKRAAKPPKYIEDSDSSADEDAEEKDDNEQEIENSKNDNNNEETAEDSYPADKETLKAAMGTTQDDFESQLLPEMVEELSTDDEARSKGKTPARHLTKQLSASKDRSVSPSEKHKQSAPKNEGPTRKTVSNQVRSKGNTAASKPTEKKLDSNNLSTLEQSLGKHAAPQKAPSAPSSVQEQEAVKDKLDTQGPAQPQATPQRSTKRLSEGLILPASEKLLRKTPIVHFGPRGPANQAVLSKSAKRRSTASDIADEIAGNLSPPRATEHDQMEDDPHPWRESSPESRRSIAQSDFNEEHTENVPAQESYEFPQRPSPAIDMHMEDDDEPAHPPSSEALNELPEIQQTQPRSAKKSSASSVEFVAAIEETHADDSNVQSVDSDDKSSVDDCYDQEASEYLASEVEDEAEEEASLPSLQVSEVQPSRKPKVPEFRPQTPLLDDDAPGRGYQRIKEPPVLRASIRPSIGVSTILDDGYPTAQKALNIKKLRPGRQSPAEDQTSRANVPTSTIPPLTQTLRESDRSDSANTADRVHGVRKSNNASFALSNSSNQGAPVGRSNEHDSTIQPKEEGTRRTSHHPFADLASAVRTEEVAAKPNKHPSTRADSTNMSATSTSVRAAQPMAPPPLPKSLPTRVMSKLNPRQSWPESQVEKKKRVAEEMTKEQLKPVHPEPVRVKKRKTLPLVADEQLPELDLPPATPASFSTRLDLHANMSGRARYSNGDSTMEDAGQKLGNGSMTLVNEEQSVLGDRSGIWTRMDRRRRSESADDVSMVASPCHQHGNAVTGEGRLGSSTLPM